MATIQSNCLALLIKTCKYLKKISLEHCDLNDDVCDGISENMNLDVLHLAMVTVILILILHLMEYLVPTLLNFF